MGMAMAGVSCSATYRMSLTPRQYKRRAVGMLLLVLLTLARRLALKLHTNPKMEPPVVIPADLILSKLHSIELRPEVPAPNVITNSHHVLISPL